MKKAFINAAGVLTAHGFMDSNNDDTAIEVEDDFTLQPGKWKLVDGTWEAYSPVPVEVSRRQARQALLLAGLLDQVQPALDAIADPTQRALMQIEWEDSQVFQRNRPQLIALATALGLSSEQLDQLFITASAL